MKKTIVVVGAGKGLGKHIALKFGAKGFRVVLMARDTQSLTSYEEEIDALGIEVHTVVADAEIPASLDQAFVEVMEQFGSVDVLAYNIGVTTPGPVESVDHHLMSRRYQVDVVAAFQCMQLVLPRQLEQGEGTILLTGGGLAIYPSPEYLCLSMDKAALRAMAIAMNAELKPKGVYVGTVTVCGAIAPDTDFDPSKIAEKFWDLYLERDECEYVFA